ncbi:MAG: hypothetical protein ACXWXZ_19335 [Candidatus Binatia bacterium]
MRIANGQLKMGFGLRFLTVSVIPVSTGIQVTDSVRHTVEQRYPGG